jgi:hypothetical protein
MPVDPRPSIVADLSCACGCVSVHVEGRVKSMFMCTCRDCQKATGTGHSTVAAFASADVKIAGDVRVFSTGADSGATMRRGFCPGCGTPIYAQSSRAPSLVLMPVGLFGGADWFAPNQVIFARSHEAWDLVAPDLPQHATYREPGGNDQQGG